MVVGRFTRIAVICRTQILVVNHAIIVCSVGSATRWSSTS